MIREWQQVRFPQSTLDGASRHLEEELDEACEEIADVFFLATQCEDLGGVPVGLPERAWEMMWRLGRDPMRVILAKLAKNKDRKWPEKPAGDGCYHHEKENNES